MKAEALLALYERVADAPEAIARLRRFVLDLAVRGKLVEQDPEDDPAADLLLRAKALRGKHKGRNTSAREAPDFDRSKDPSSSTVPRGWLSVRLGEVIRLLSGQHLQPNEYSEREGDGVPYITGPSDFGSAGLVISRYALAKKAVARRGQLLLTVKGSGLGKTHLCELEEVAISRQLMALEPLGWSVRFLRLVTQRLAEELQGQARSLIPGIGRTDVEDFVFAIPPLAEQHRIVAKVDELMALLDRLDAARSAREATRDRLTTASLTRLTAPDTAPESLRTHARFALDALPALTTRADQIKQLRQTILNLAVRGRLVEQDAADEPATNLLLRIEEQRSALSLTSRQAPPRESEAPFPLPSGWRIARLGDLCSKTGSGSTPRGGKEVYRSSGVAFLRSQNVHNDGVRLDDVAYIDHQTHQRMSGTHVLAGDLLLNITGGSIGRCARVPHDFCDANLSQHVAIIRPAEPGIQRFLHWLILSPYFQGFVMDEQTGAGRGGLPKNRMDRILVPVPPLAEQHRIVAKVDELMALCDRLEAALQSADRTRASLLEALLHEALNSRADNLIDFAEARTRLRPTRSEVGSLIVHHQARRGQGGRIKLGKSLYLAEAHCGLSLGGSFGRANFGPHDEWIYTFEREGCHAGWFSVSERSFGDGKLRAEYTPGPALAAKADDARAGLGEQAAELERVLDLLAPLTAEEAEIAATLFAAWNDLLLEGAVVTDEAIVTEVREHWHPSKARFSPGDLHSWLSWLRRNDLVPQGLPPSTRHQASLFQD